MKKFFSPFKGTASEAQTNHFAFVFAKAAGPVSDELKKLVENKDYRGLIDYKLDYTRFERSDHVYAARQCLAFYSKNAGLNLGVDRERAALAKFIEGEAICKETNKRLRRERCVGGSRVNAIMYSASQKIASILGPVPSLEDLQLQYGPGANTNVRIKTSARWKLAAKPVCSADMAGVVDDVLAELPHLTRHHSHIETDDSWFIEVGIEPGVWMSVPKNALTNRSIIIGTNLCTMVQKGYGSHIKRRLLKRAKVNLYDQTINNRLARMASLDDGIATVDLVNASDTKAYVLVSELIPYDWFDALSRCRESLVHIPDLNSTFELEKFSSMGNGFTFELESLIFYALTWAVCRELNLPTKNISVYGDDIICPSACKDLLVETFSFCGFEINTSKSYFEGPFRESCGKDYFRGTNVRPFYQKEFWSYATLTAFHNFLWRSGWGFFDDFSTVSNDIIEIIKKSPYLNYGPDGFGDGHLLGDWSPIHCNRKKGWSGYTFSTMSRKQRKYKGFCSGDRLIPIYSVYIGATKQNKLDKALIRGHDGEVKTDVYTLQR